MDRELIAKLFISDTIEDLFIIVSLIEDGDELFELLWLTTCLAFVCSEWEGELYSQLLQLLEEKFGEGIDEEDDKLSYILMPDTNGRIEREYKEEEMTDLKTILNEILNGYTTNSITY